MPPHAIGAGTISFGLVTIPIKVYSPNRATESISFNMLHEKCNSRLKQQYICPACDEIVERSEMVKGYEFAKNQYVLFSKDELKALEEKSTQTIEVTEFVPSETIDPIYFDKSFYLGPDRHGDRAYYLLSKALETMGRWALAKYAMRGKQYLVALRPAKGGLIMEQLHYAYAVRSMDEIGLEGDVEVKEKELELAIMLANQALDDEFHPENYRDEVHERLKETIQRKVEGEQVSLVPVEEPAGKVIDLMEALRASLEGSALRNPATEKVAARTAARRKPAKRAEPKKAAAKKRSKKAASR